MKLETTKKGAPKSQAEAEAVWQRVWNQDLRQERIQAWIERIIVHIQKVLELEGGNGYIEDRSKNRLVDSVVCCC